LKDNKMTRISALPPGDCPELKDAFAVYERALGFIPNSVLIMQRRPKMVAALSQLAASVWDRNSTVDIGFKRLVAHMASRAHGCQYCVAHTAGAAMRLGVEAEKLDQLWSYQISPLYTLAERVALDFALAAGSVPNAVDDELFDRMKQHWSEDDIVEITGVIALFGFMNRWNDTMATPLEQEPLEVGEKHLAKNGWSAGKHGEGS
jgi:uncharacterized peroxidase-related enzyme